MDVPAPQRILVVRLSHLGDVVHGVPVLHALRAAHPDARLGWAIQGEFADLIRPLEGLERVFLFDRRGGLGAWLRLRRELRAWRPDWSVDAQGNTKSAAVAWCAGARARFGLAPQDWQERLGARFLTHPAPPSYGSHVVHRTRALLERAAPDAGTSFDLEVSPAERAAGDGALTRLVGPAEDGRRPLWVLCLATEGDPRSWPADRFARLAGRLADGGGRVLLLSGPDEAGEGARLERELPERPDVAHWVGQRGLRELAGLFAAAAARGARVVACDSGPCHIAAACGAGVDLLAGPQDPRRSGPWPPPGPGSPHRWLTAASSPGPIEELTVDAVAAELLGPDPAA